MAALTSPPLASPARKQFTRSDVERMERAGVFPDDRLELIDGDLFDKMGQNPPHAFVLQELSAILCEIFGFRFLRIQLPLEVSPNDQSQNRPEPDIAVVRNPPHVYKTKHPQGESAVLVVEIADASVNQDLSVKRRLYARASVLRYWVVDVARRVLIVHELPAADDYASVQTFGENDAVPVPASNAQFTLSSILP